MDIEPIKLLNDVFGFSSFREGQEQVIAHLLAGKSAVAVFPTAAGKSLCFQLPALTFEGLTLVVSPLKALMKDQVDALRRKSIAARHLDSSLSAEEFNTTMAEVRNGALKILYVAPERFNNERFRTAMKGVRISLFAIDEAHSISEWGHNFRPDYLKLAEYARYFNSERVVALTATATPQVLEDICKAFNIESSCATRTGFYRSNLTLLSSLVEATGRDSYLLEKLRERPPGPTVVYVTLQKSAEEVAQLLLSAGFEARAFHAGLSESLKPKIQDWFMRSDEAIVVATIAFGMGVDKPNIRYVYHYNLPKSLEGYSQEVGRAGRDGEPSVCEMLVCTDDLATLENFVVGSTPTLAAVTTLLEEVFSSGEFFNVNFVTLSRAHGIRELVVRTLMTYLELDGFLAQVATFYGSFRFKPMKPSAEILTAYHGQERQFIHQVLALSVGKKVWFTIDVDVAVKKIGCSRESVISVLDRLNETRAIDLKAEDRRVAYRAVEWPHSLVDLSQSLHQRMVLREKRELERLGEVMDLVQLADCQTQHLCNYFGTPIAQRCGHCSACMRDPYIFYGSNSE